MRFSNILLERYSRTILLNEIGIEGQKRISESKVLIIGAGGLSSTIIPILAAAGVAQITVAEADNLELSNLQRQFLYNSFQVGLPKAHLIKDFISHLNPSVNIELIEYFLLKKNYQSFENIISNYHAIIDASDSFEARVLSNQLAIKAKIPFFTGAAIAFCGHIYSFFGYKSNKACYSCLFGNDYTTFKDSKNCATTGVFPSLPGMVGTFIAHNFLSYFALQEENAKFILIDFLKKPPFKEIEIKKDDKCAICIIN